MMKKQYGAYVEHIGLDVFDCTVHIAVTAHPNEYIDKAGLRVWTGDDPNHDFEKFCDGLCVSKDNSDFYIIIPPDATLNVAVHEACHAINQVFSLRGQIADFDNDEVYCYYLGWLAQKVIDHLNKVYQTITKDKN